MGGRLVDTLSSVASPVECMRRCQATLACEYWQHNFVSDTCKLMDRDAIAWKKRDMESFSGPKFCDDQKFLG